MGPGDPFRALSERPRRSYPAAVPSVPPPPPRSIPTAALSPLERRALAGVALGTAFGFCVLEVGLGRALIVAACGLVGGVLAARSGPTLDRLRRRLR